MISVIVPVYNTQKYLRRCVDSLICQTYGDIEILLIDDGATDGSGELCDDLALQSDRIRVFHKMNGGLSDARNRGIEEAKGEYLSFIDSDDFVHPKMLEVLYNNLSEFEADISVCSYWRQEEGSAINEEVIADAPVVKEGSAVLKQFLDNKSDTVCAWNKLYKREIFHTIRYPVGKLHEDEFVILDLLSGCKRIVYSPLKLYYYMQHSDSIMGKLSDKRVKDTLESFEYHVRFFEERGMLEERNEAFAIWKREIYKKYDGCSKEKFAGYQKTQLWLRKELRKKLPELRKKEIITAREWAIRLVWTYSPFCGTLLEQLAGKKQWIRKVLTPNRQEKH